MYRVICIQDLEDGKQQRITERKTLRITSVPFEREGNFLLDLIQAKISLGSCLKFHSEKLKIFTSPCTFSVISIKSQYFDPPRSLVSLFCFLIPLHSLLTFSLYFFKKLLAQHLNTRTLDTPSHPESSFLFCQGW